jgi:hypothetical protein
MSLGFKILATVSRQCYWQQSVDSVMYLPPLTDFGWSTDDNILSVIWDTVPPLTDFGWSTDDNILSVIWVTEANVKRVNDTIQWYTKGCSCKKGCLTNKCSCRRSRGDGQTGYCRPGCKCINC